eukprot:4403084-Pyramimonas_sp.AAC.1
MATNRRGPRRPFLRKTTRRNMSFRSRPGRGTVASVIRGESRQRKALAKEDAVAHDELRTALQEEEADARRSRL